MANLPRLANSPPLIHTSRTPLLHTSRSQLLGTLSGFKLLMLVVVGAAGILMVSNIRYYSFKDLDFKKPVPFVVLLAVVLGFVMISVEPSVMLLLLFAAYVCSGPILAVMRKAKPKR